MLELNADHKMTVDNRRALERQKVKYMAIIYNGKGIESLRKHELKMCFDLKIIDEHLFEQEKQRRRAVYLLLKYQNQIKSKGSKLSQKSDSFGSISSLKK